MKPDNIKTEVYDRINIVERVHQSGGPFLHKVEYLQYDVYLDGKFFCSETFDPTQWSGSPLSKFLQWLLYKGGSGLSEMDVDKKIKTAIEGVIEAFNDRLREMAGTTESHPNTVDGNEPKTFEGASLNPNEY